MLPRTFVASHGLDTNDGRLTTPCRSIGAALAQTDPGGEIIVLDSAGYGTVTIDKSVSITAPRGIYAGITVTAGTGVDVTAGNVALRGLTIRGPGGAIGIHVGNAIVRIEHCVIFGLGQFGIHADTTNGELHVRDTQVAQCAEGIRVDGSIRFSLERVRTEANGSAGLTVLTGATGSAVGLASVRNGNYGIGVSNTKAGSTTTLVIDASSITHNGATGISTGIPVPVAGRTFVSVTRSLIACNGVDGMSLSTQGSGSAVGAVSDCVIDLNSARGLSATGVGAVVAVCGNRVTSNTSFGFDQSAGAVVESEQDNMLRGNNGGGAQTNGAVGVLASV
jgi:hypothetical protein